jgi:hypothetical protein
MPLELNRRLRAPGRENPEPAPNPDPTVDPYTIPDVVPTTPEPGSGDTGGGGGGGGGGNGGGSYTPYETPDYGGPLSPNYNFEPIPLFHAPVFQQPTAEEALAEPGYQFRLNQGEQALQQSAAGRGTLRTGMTLKDILEYGQNFASQEYSNVFDRALAQYDRRYQGSRDEYSPLLIDWQTRMAAMQRAADLGWQRAWDDYVFGITHQWDVDRTGLELGQA